MQFYSGPLMHFLSGVDTDADGNIVIELWQHRYRVIDAENPQKVLDHLRSRRLFS
jgi:hypothetical protein